MQSLCFSHITYYSLQGFIFPLETHVYGPRCRTFLKDSKLLFKNDYPLTNTKVPGLVRSSANMQKYIEKAFR